MRWVLNAATLLLPLAVAACRAELAEPPVAPSVIMTSPRSAPAPTVAPAETSTAPVAPTPPSPATRATVITLADGRRVAALLPPEVIQKIIRDGFPPLRKCYEDGLARNPKLQGLVRVRFVIGLDGRVAQAKEGRDEAQPKAPASPPAKRMPDPEVVSCVLREFRAFEFPEPEGGIVTVTYPIMFAPGG